MFQHRFCFAIVVATSLLAGCNNGTTPGPTGTNNGGAATNKQLTKADYAEAIRLKNRSLGHLENMEWKDAEATLTKLVKVAPDALLPRRNLAISRVLMLISRSSPYPQTGSPEKEQKYQAAYVAAEEAVSAYRDFATENYDKALADLLMGKLLVHHHSLSTGGIDDGVKLLQKAADAMPEAADFRFAVAMAMDGHRDYADPDSPKSAELLRELQKSVELAPQNLAACQKLMMRQALCLGSKNPDTHNAALKIKDTLQSVTRLLAPLNESIKKQRRTDLIDLITKALSAFDESKPESLKGPALMTGNLLSPEIATLIDLRRINRFILEYVLTDFDPKFLALATEAEAIPQPEESVLKSFKKAEGLPTLNGVTAIDMLDMDLNGYDDLVVARDGSVEVYSRGADLNGEWKLLLKTPESDVAFTRFLLADIDRDNDKAISELTAPSILRDIDGDVRIVKDPTGKNRWYDTDLDVIAWSADGVRIFRNDLGEDGQRSLTPLPQEASVTGINDVLAADLEADGDLDLVFATTTGMSLWKNLDGANFVSMNGTAALPEHEIQSIALVDWNRDVAMDIVGMSADGHGGYLENIFHGRFRWVPFERQIPVAEGAEGITGINITGPNRLGKFELWCAGAGSLSQSTDNTNIKEGTREKQTAVKRLFADFDNDGRTDFINLGGPSTAASLSIGIPGFPKDLFASDGVATDFDDDGDLDVVYIDAKTGELGLLTNDGGNENNWVDIVARGKPDDPQFPSQRVNMHAIGSVIELRAGSLYHGEIITGPKVHLGLGKANSADTVRIIWTDGVPQHLTIEKMLNAKLGVLAPQILIGSCPYIYTWSGDRFEFFSDCLWAAPLGLVQANGELAPTREWENLLIPGEALKEKDGQYVLQLTEELRETAYFDNVQLTAIDHPADVKIFTNEKVGSPQMAEHRVHTVRHPRLPVSVVDGRGNDLLPGLTELDGDYIQAFAGRVMQGVTDEWTMEFDLGELPPRATDTETGERNVRLFLTGWVFPTDTSLNEGIIQNANQPPPAPPSIEVPDGSDGWISIRPFIGFPSGKTKAMVVDISDIVSENNSRFRIRSSMELYWDQAFFTVDETDAETVVQTCNLTAADLHYRGFSRRTYANNALFRNGRAPENYDYNSVRTQAMWPAISGRFTRYGDTLPLLTTHDDKMVVMGPGDELTVKFSLPDKPVPKGWKRDFVLRNVGYDKDANLNTIYGQSSEPFPFRSMSRYPFAADERFPDSPDHQRYLNEWQTREYSPDPFLNSIRRMEVPTDRVSEK